jgi:hypothetical protein
MIVVIDDYEIENVPAIVMNFASLIIINRKKYSQIYKCRCELLADEGKVFVMPNVFMTPSEIINVYEKGDYDTIRKNIKIFNKLNKI